MYMQSVSSSDLSRVGYENGTLIIEFSSGEVYSYSGVPVSVYQGLMSAVSHGKFFHAHIKNVYPYERIG